MSVVTLWKVNISSTGKELNELILIHAKLWLVLSEIPIFSLIRYLTLSQILSNHS